MFGVATVDHFVHMFWLAQILAGLAKTMSYPNKSKTVIKIRSNKCHMLCEAFNFN